MLAFFNKVILLLIVVGTSSCLLNDNQVELKGFGSKYPDRLEIEGFGSYTEGYSDPGDRISSSQIFDFEINDDKKVVGIIWPENQIISEFIIGTTNQQIIKTNVNYANNLVAGIAHLDGNGAVVKKIDFTYEEGQLTNIITTQDTFSVADSIYYSADRTYVSRTISKPNSLQENLLILFNREASEPLMYVENINDFTTNDIDSISQFYKNSTTQDPDYCPYFYSPNSVSNPLILQTNYAILSQDIYGYGDNDEVVNGVVHVRDNSNAQTYFYPIADQWSYIVDSGVDSYSGGEGIYIEMPQYVSENDMFMELKLFPFLRPDSIVTKIGQLELFDNANMPLNQDQIDYFSKRIIIMEGSFYYNYETY